MPAEIFRPGCGLFVSFSRTIIPAFLFFLVSFLTTPITAQTVGDLVATGQDIKWYSVPSGGTPLDPSTPLVDGQRYYASQTVNGVESPLRLEVVASVNDVPEPVAGTHVPQVTEIEWNWGPVAGALGYKWNTVNELASAVDLGLTVEQTESGLTCNTGYTRYLWAYDATCHSQPVALTGSTLPGTPEIPGEGTHQAAVSQIIWNWQPAAGATGYRWSAVNDFATATDLGAVTSLTEKRLYPNTSYTRYLWAYNSCGASPVRILSTGTTDFECGVSTLTISHFASGGVAPVDKNTSYGTAINIPGEPSKCWITSNLGSDHQAAAVNDATEPSAGWYWQFNRKQGYKHTGTVRTPATAWITSISETSDWTPANDPCTSELGIGWHIPTATEWSNVRAGGGWTTWTGPWSSLLRLHGAGFISNGSLMYQGVGGWFWSNSNYSSTSAYLLYISSGTCSVGSNSKPTGYTLRCIGDSCSLPPGPASESTHVPGVNSVTWNWTAVTGALGYKGNSVNDFSTATDLGSGTTWTENGLICNTSNTRYIWVYNGCGHSSPVTLTQTTLPGTFLDVPVPAAHIISDTMVIWKWSAVPDATGYKWNTINDWATATDLGQVTTLIETGLACNTVYTRYLWAYTPCIHSAEVTLRDTTRHCGLFVCGTDTWPAIHRTTGGVAPVDKITSYGTKAALPGEPLKCWITSNLGSDHQAAWVNDATEPSAGWYWQFNRKKGYKHDGTTLTPAWTITSISETGNWLPANDPCALELGGPWRIPTYTEWINVDYNGSWNNWGGPWYSGLYLHFAGYLSTANGAIASRGTYGYYWGSTSFDNTYAATLRFESAGSGTLGMTKATGAPLRCIRWTCSGPPAPPAAGTHSSAMNWITWNWGAVPDALGYRYNTVNDVATATDMGTTRTKTEEGLTFGTGYTRYVWSYNNCGNSAVAVLVQPTQVCGASGLWVSHTTAGGVAPVAKTTGYGTAPDLPGEPAKCWITKNLGADYESYAPYDETESAAGWYWQFNRKQGYRATGSTPTPAWTVTSINENSDWLLANDPCNLLLGTQWRIPSYSEWYNVDLAGGWSEYNAAWNSLLKLNAAGYLAKTNGAVNARGQTGYYWSGSQSDNQNGPAFTIGIAVSEMNTREKAYGNTLRCISLSCTAAPPSPAAGTHVPGYGRITWNWSVTAGAVGYRWSAVNDYSTATDVGTSTTQTETGLGCNLNYTRYVWAYNSCGYSAAAALTATTLAGIPGVPAEMTEAASDVQITWSWSAPTGAVGYRWNTTSDFGTATDLGSATFMVETGLTCNTGYTRYVWAYNACGVSLPVALSGTTRHCGDFICGTDSVPVTHLVSGGVAPIQKITNYGTVTGLAGEETKCWITKNLGADRQATASNDATEPSVGWYWQFNRKKGFKHTGDYPGIGPTPAWSINSISENADWLPANDPCTLELGSGWHVPTQTEWVNAVAGGGWTTSAAVWNSGLKLHAGGYLNKSAGVLGSRGVSGDYWSNTQSSNAQGHDYNFGSANGSMVLRDKAYGFPLRCISHFCTAAPFSPTAGTPVVGYDMITWNWAVTAGAAGYRWNTVNDYATATDMGTATTRTETGLGCNLSYTRYVWAYNSCGHSAETALTAVSPAGIPGEPAEGPEVVSDVQVTWTWTTPAGATGYRWSATDDYGTAIDLGQATYRVETGLTCNTGYTRYVWAYNVCGNTLPVTLTATTRHCGAFVCGTDSVPGTHLVSGGVAPVQKITNYGTVTGLAGEVTKCWITKNLGADRQALASNDATEPSAGWYWQFNRKKGYKHDGTTLTPAWTITSISESSNWQSANDPCSLELGSGWHIPTQTEWTNAVAGGGWTTSAAVWSSGLKLHVGGYLDKGSGTLGNRGLYGDTWSNTQSSSTQGHDYNFGSANGSMVLRDKAYGFPLRCISGN